MYNRNNLPVEVSSFIGREHELEQLAQMLRQQRLVTLTGSGGAGKTRLALHAAAGHQDEYAQGVWLVELAPLSAPELVVDSITKAVAAPESSAIDPLEALAIFLERRQILIILDNCEHLLAECARVAAVLLGRCPAVTILATSREALAVNGEWVLRVPPLSLPTLTLPLDQDKLLDFDAIRLFVERAHAAEPSFSLSSVTATSVVEICRRLDGIPLALELAAGRVRGMGVAYLSSRLDNRFRLLKSSGQLGEPRQRTLLALVDWSYALLSEREQVILRRLSIFAGDFSIEAAESVCAREHENKRGQEAVSADAVFDDLTRLVDKSLVQLDHDTGRYRLLETIRIFGLDRLAEAGETDSISTQHFDYYLLHALGGVSFIGGIGEEAWFNQIDWEHDNYRAALDWALHVERTEDAARMALAIWRYWHSRTHLHEGLRWLDRIQVLDSTHPLSAELRPWLFNAIGVMSSRTHSFDRARSCHAEALRLWTEAKDRGGMAQALLDIGWQHWDQVEIDAAKQCATKSLHLAQEAGDKRLIAAALYLNATLDSHLGRLDEAIATFERSLATWRDLGDMDSIASTSAGLATVYQQRGEYERAKPMLAEAARLQLRSKSASLTGTLVGLMFLSANIAKEPAQVRDAVRAFGALIAWDEATSIEPSPWLSASSSQGHMAKLAAALEPDDYAQALVEGKNLTTAGLLDLVDRVTAPANNSVVQPKPTSHAPHDDLTPRELEVLRLVAQGMTNAAAANVLTVTPRTINAHLTAIYAKLGVPSRSGAIRYALHHHLDE